MQGSVRIGRLREQSLSWSLAHDNIATVRVIVFE